MAEFEATDGAEEQTDKTSSYENKPEVSESRKALVGKWCQRAKRAKKKYEKDFKRMDKAQQLATDGADEAWTKAGRYIVPIINRHINSTVSQLYAKDPRVVAKRRKKLLFKLWDGNPQSYQEALIAAAPPITDPMTGQAPMDPMTGMPMQGDPMAMELVTEVQAAQQEVQMMDKLGKTLECLWSYYTNEQAGTLKTHLKAAVRRAKVNGVAYVKLLFQREMQKNPEIVAKIDDVASQIANFEQGMKQLAEGEIDESSARIEELRLIQQQLEAEPDIVIREGPVFDFPNSKEIFPDTKCRHLKTFSGSDVIFHEFDLTPDEIEQIYGVDVKGCYTEMKDQDKDFRTESNDDDKQDAKGRVYEIQDRANGQRLVICLGYHDFLVEPSAPEVKIERFWTVFPIVFNEIENDKRIYPPSDAMLLADTQKSFNESRQGLREHRKANKPKYATAKGALEKSDKDKLASYETNAVLELKGLKPGQPVNQLIQPLAGIPIDPQQYDVEPLFNDLLRTVGAQQADLGPTSGSTATESSIAQAGRNASLADNVDDLDDMLSELARAFSQLCLMELAKDTVEQICGVGCVWPDSPLAREEIARDLFLEVRAGSSGRPNAAAELAKWERATPILLQLPGMNPKAIATKMADALDVDIDELYLEGLPSITAINAAMSKPQPMAGGDPNSPEGQGAEGAQNAPQGSQGNDGPQPAMPDGQQANPQVGQPY
jgi:hypothetical protein